MSFGKSRLITIAVAAVAGAAFVGWVMNARRQQGGSGDNPTTLGGKVGKTLGF